MAHLGDCTSIRTQSNEELEIQARLGWEICEREAGLLPQAKVRTRNIYGRDC